MITKHVVFLFNHSIGLLLRPVWTYETLYCINLGIVIELILFQVQWFYFTSTGYQPYPADINALIETAYRSQTLSANWNEPDGTYWIDFKSMMESRHGSMFPMTPVKRVSAGEISHLGSY